MVLGMVALSGHVGTNMEANLSSATVFLCSVVL